jgi:prophage DNA circulation protein
MSQGFTFDASFGGIRIDVISTSITHGRKRVDHGFPKKDGVTQEDLGREPFVCNLQFVFIDRRPQEGESTVEPYDQRFLDFDALVGGDSVRRLVHPYVGAVLCGISRFSHNADADGGPAIFCSATFTEENSLPPVFAAGGGIHTLAGAQEVRTSAIAASEALEAAGLEETATLTDCVDSAEEWQSSNVITVRQVQHQMAQLNNRLNNELDAYEVATEIDQYPVFKEYTKLQYNLRRAAEGFTAGTTRIVSITTTQPLPLRVLAARFYGAAQAEERFGEMLELNPGIVNPGLIGADITLKAYSRNA